jgi:hypothetical protein
MKYLDIPELMVGSTSPRSSMSSESICSDSMSRSDGEDFCGQTKKKRSRANLSNMSLEDKIQRRKLKNRVAAQAARDRKKSKMDTMEVTLSRFSEERLKLVRENDLLKKENERLKMENARLLDRLAGRDDASLTTAVVPSSSEKKNPQSPKKTNLKSNPFESAALIHDSQPQKQGLLPSTESSEDEGHPSLKRDWELQTSQATSQISMMPFVSLLLTLANQTKSSSGSRSVQQNFSQTIHPKILPKNPDSLLIPSHTTSLPPSSQTSRSPKRNWKDSET